MAKKIKGLLGLSILQAVGAFVVVWLWAQLMVHGEQWFGKTAPNILGMVTMPLIFIIVATLSAGAVLGYPLYLAFNEKDWPKAVKLLSLTLLWLAIISLILILSFVR